MARASTPADAGISISPYTIGDHDLPAGSTLGGPKAFVTIKATGALEKFYSIDAGQVLVGTVLTHHWDERTGVRLHARHGDFQLWPDRQEHEFAFADRIAVRETILVLSGKPDGRDVDPPAAYYVIELTNESDETKTISTYVAARMRGETGHDVVTAYDAELHAVAAWNVAKPNIVRHVGSTVAPKTYEVTCDAARTSATTFPGPLKNTLDPDGYEPIALLHFSHELGPGTSTTFAIVVTCSIDGRAAAAHVHASAPTPEHAIARTREWYTEVLGRAIVATPEADINRGVLWAKTNMLRIETLAQTGWSFVNDPTNSHNSVGRDTAWFAYGADYVTPDFAGESLEWYATHLEDDGLVVEYYDIRDGKPSTYGLNINDNTPLLIIALKHHADATGNRGFLERNFPHAEKAARKILKERDDRGLVWCTSTKTSDWGIVGWRNVIKNYRLSGATTELNSECFAALSTFALMATALEKHELASEFRGHARDLKAAIDEHLTNPDNGLYLLNIDVDGRRRTDITSDMVFPVLFGVADEPTAARVINRLRVDEFWTDAGIRVVPRYAIDYSPGKTPGYGLLGGVWVGATFWYAFAAARFDPDFVATSLRDSFRHYALDPIRYNTVPGEFSEWLHGETLANEGMLMSPWYPPRYVWAAIEGAMGLEFRDGPPALVPRLPPNWLWSGVRNLQLRGGESSWFVARTPDLTLYSTCEFARNAPYERYDADVTGRLRVADPAIVGFAFEREGEVVLLLGNTSANTITTGVRFDGAFDGTIQSWNSAQPQWLHDDRTAKRPARASASSSSDRVSFSSAHAREPRREAVYLRHQRIHDDTLVVRTRPRTVPEARRRRDRSVRIQAES